MKDVFKILHSHCFPILLSFLIILPLASLSGSSAQPLEDMVIGNFSRAAAGNVLPQGWEPLTFKKIPRKTVYSLVQDDGVVVVKATSSAAASGLIRRVRINPLDYPIIQWRWKVTNVYQKGDVTRKEGDDYPARVYITFEYDPAKTGFFDKVKYESARLLYGEYPPGNAITYIWGSKAPVGTIAPNPYTERAGMIVLESGTARSNQWVREERNVFKDFQKFFTIAPSFITGIALMTDSDNTGESATAYYGDIVLKKNGSLR